jgi:hypothetical protein
MHILFHKDMHLYPSDGLSELKIMVRFELFRVYGRARSELDDESANNPTLLIVFS